MHTTMMLAPVSSQTPSQNVTFYTVNPYLSDATPRANRAIAYSTGQTLMLNMVKVCL